jgi:alpha-beta hydrolase superfamily lysophospholipase
VTTWRGGPAARPAFIVSLLLLLLGCAGDGDGSAPDATDRAAGADASDAPDADASDAPDASEAGSDGLDEEVTVPADGLDLVGTLRVPAGPGPHPGIVIVPGSGPQSRRGTAPGQLGLTLPRPVPVYEELAIGLRDAGYAVLTFDKRTCGPFNGCADNDYPTPPPDLSFGTFATDVALLLDHLAAREDIGELVLVGHSKGGTVAAQVADQRDDLAAIVLLASPAVPIDEVIAEQADTFADLVAAAGPSQPGADQAIAELRSLAADVADIATGEVDGEPVGGVPRAFWSDWIEGGRAAPDHIAATSASVLVLGGGNDWNVPPVQVEAWAPFLDDEDDHLEILPGITHALTRLDEDDPAAITPADVGTQVDPVVVDTIAGWLAATLD